MIKIKEMSLIVRSKKVRTEFRTTELRACLVISVGGSWYTGRLVYIIKNSKGSQLHCFVKDSITIFLPFHDVVFHKFPLMLLFSAPTHKRVFHLPSFLPLVHAVWAHTLYARSTHRSLGNFTWVAYNRGFHWFKLCKVWPHWFRKGLVDWGLLRVAKCCCSFVAKSCIWTLK